VSGATSYQICQSTASSTCATSFSAGTTTSTNSAIVTGLTNGTTYYFTVKAVASCGTASTNASSVANVSPIAPYACGTATVTDNNGSIVYNTVWIDINQDSILNTGECWFKQNLATTVKQDGVTALIHNAGNDYVCASNNGSGEDCPNSTSGSASILGNLYNWAVVMNLASSCNSTDCSASITTPHRGLCPVGWHIPTDTEWANLINYAETYAGGANPATCATTGSCSNAGAVLKENNTDYWNSLGTPTANNNLNLTVRGAGYNYSGFYGRKTDAYFWTSTQGTAGGGRIRNFVYNNASVSRSNNGKSWYLSARCVKD
jgi:uncharacterized protein (TIGR02145 family)